MDERLAGGNTGGAVRVGDTIRRSAGPWTSSVHSVLDHLAAKRFTGAPRAWDLAFTAFAWIPLHARQVVTGEGFTDFADRPRRLELFLREYGWTGSRRHFLAIVQARVAASADGILRTAAAGDPAYQQMIERGVEADLRTAIAELDGFTG